MQWCTLLKVRWLPLLDTHHKYTLLLDLLLPDSKDSESSPEPLPYSTENSTSVQHWRPVLKWLCTHCGSRRLQSKKNFFCAKMLTLKASPEKVVNERVNEGAMDLKITQTLSPQKNISFSVMICVISKAHILISLWLQHINRKYYLIDKRNQMFIVSDRIHT